MSPCERTCRAGRDSRGTAGVTFGLVPFALPWGHPGRDVNGQVASSLEKPGLEAETGAPGHSGAGGQSPGSRRCEGKALMARRGP